MFRVFQFNVLQLPNVLAVDAALIALCWHMVFASASGQSVYFTTASVLSLSVWLTYTADRLFDVAKRTMNQLHSTRHRFAKQHAPTLWKIWFGILVINIGIAFTGLTTRQLLNGVALLTFCLLYTGLNQKLSSRFFPKELCVAIIYAAGVIVFLLPAPSLWVPAGFLMLLCLINCLMISNNEQQIDAAMKVRSMAQFMPKLPIALYLCCTLMLGLMETQWLLPIGSSLAALIVVHFCRKRLSVESFRVLADAALLAGPLLTLLFDSIAK